MQMGIIERLDHNRRLNGRQQRLGVRADNLLDLLPILEDQECRHGTDAQLLRNIGNLIDVELDEVSAGELIGEPVGKRVSACPR